MIPLETIFEGAAVASVRLTVDDLRSADRTYWACLWRYAGAAVAREEGYTYRQIAEFINRSPSTVAQQVGYYLGERKAAVRRKVWDGMLPPVVTRWEEDAT